MSVETKTNKPRKKRKKAVKPKMLPKKDLTETGYCVRLNENGKYDVVTIKYDIDSKQAYVAKVDTFAKTHYQAVHRFKKLMVENKIIPNKKTKGEKE